MIHVYYGNGKGKTTAALGLAVRALGCGKRVIIVQFLKRRESGEIAVLESLDGITLLRGKATDKFSFEMNSQEKKLTKVVHDEHLKKAAHLVEEGSCDLLILDEVLCAIAAQLLDESFFVAFLERLPDNVEIVLTGQKAPDYIRDKADYITHMQAEKHPFKQGTLARKGVEF